MDEATRSEGTEWIRALEAQIKDLRESYETLERRHQGACQTVERLAPLARENQTLKFDCCQYLDRISRLEQQVAGLGRENKLLRDIAADSTQTNVIAAQILGEVMTR